MFKKFKDDWAIATKKEKVKFIMVTFLEILLAIPIIYYLRNGTSGIAENWNARYILYSYASFIVLVLLVRVNLTPKARKQNDNK